jgi:hypothetical protein
MMLKFLSNALTTSLTGMVGYEHPVGIAGGNSSITSFSTVCPSCHCSCTLGLTYCLDCCVLLPGRSDRNIFHQAPRRETGVAFSAGGNSSAEQPSDPAFKRHGDPEAAKLIAEATLYTVTVKEKRGLSSRVNLQRTNPSNAFKSYCKEILRRTNRVTGFPLSEDQGSLLVFFNDVPDGKKLRRRAELDHGRFPDNVREKMRTTHRSCISDQELADLDSTECFLDWCDYMNDVALRAHGVNWNPRPKVQRDNAPPVKNIKSSGTNSASGTSVPLASLPGYAELKSQVDKDNRNAAMARTAASRSSQSKSAASSRPGVPSDGKGCDHCGGNHYARDRK